MFLDLMAGDHERGLAQALPHLGFVTFVVDGRGTPWRSREFQNVVYRNFGRNEIPDHVATLQQLAADRPWMDMSRVGITGHSWGGYMTLRGMVLAPEVFRVGVALYPVADLWDHWGMPIEAFMGLPQDNPEGYEYASSLRLADRIEGRLLILHGTSDLNAPFSSSIKMVDAMVRLGKLVEMVPLAEQTHILAPHAKHYFRKALGHYFLEHL
jgi:dipeptidyl aminopeptidase/acylaminoacyl peptidase